MLLHVKKVRARLGLRDAVHAVPNLRFRIGDVQRFQSLVDRLPGLSAVVAAERAGRGDGNKNSAVIFWIQQNRVQAHSAGARLPVRAGAVSAQTRKLVPGLSTVGGFE